MRTFQLQHRQEAPLITPSDLKAEAVKDIARAMNAVLADVFALYLKTKNFHWHMSGPHFRDYHLLLDEHADQIFAMTDLIAERVRKIGGLTIRSIGNVQRLQRVLDNDADYVEPEDMLAELREDTPGSFDPVQPGSPISRRKMPWLYCSVLGDRFYCIAGFGNDSPLLTWAQDFAHLVTPRFKIID